MTSYENPRSLAPTDAELAEIYPDNEPKIRDCRNCTHRIVVNIEFKLYDLCVQERDETGKGEVFECDPDLGCDYHEWDGTFLEGD